MYNQTMWVVLFALAGLVEGFVVVKCMVPYPQVLADQFIFRNFIILKMFMSAVGASMVAQAFLMRSNPAKFEASRSYARDSFGIPRVVGGSALVGIGMATAGSGPTMFGPALGCGIETSWAYVVGGLLGALAISVLDALGMNAKACPIPEKKDTTGVEKMLGMTYFKMAFVGGSAMLLCTVALEIIVPFTEDASKYTGGQSSIAGPWPPILAGCSIGLGQVAVRMLSGDGMGGATTMHSAISVLTCETLAKESSPRKPAMRFQPVYNYIFVLAGAWLASGNWTRAEGEPLTEGFDITRCLVGSFLAVFGSLVAGGCTCGHGVSGTSELSIESFFGAGTVFGVAIAAGLIFNALDVTNHINVHTA